MRAILPVLALLLAFLGMPGHAAADPGLQVVAPVTSAKVAPHASVEFPLNVSNLGDAPIDVTFALAPSDKDTDWAPIVPRPTGLAAGETKGVALFVRAPAAFGYVSAARAFTVEVTAAPPGGGEVERAAVSVIAHVEGFYAPTPAWAPFAAGALAVAGAGARRR